MYATVIFSTHRTARRLPKRPLAAIRRHPGLLYQYALSRLTAVLTRSDVTHVAIGVDGLVISRYVHGGAGYGINAYLLAYPRLSEAFGVRLSRPIDPEPWLDRLGPASPWPSICRAITRGRTPVVLDCVGVACEILRAGGVGVPRRTYSPVGLRDWLLTEGYHHVTLD